MAHDLVQNGSATPTPAPGPTPAPAPLPPLAADAPIVVALGGNALSAADGSDDVEHQYEQTRRSAAVLADLLESRSAIVITHGNGPQVGSAVRRSELAAHEVYAVPLSVLVADLQGGIGFMISECVNNELRRRGVDRIVSTLITSVEVDDDDPAFENPTKPIGAYYDAERATELKGQGWQMTEIPGRGFRRVVPSPVPRHIVEIDLIRSLVKAGEAIIAVGGGGVPIVRDAQGIASTREAVVDKDLASGLLAREIDAGLLFLVTTVPRVALDYGKPTQRDLDRMTVDEARRYRDAGHFPPGSMGPKITAAIEFLEGTRRPDARVVITDIVHMSEALEGRSATIITR